MVWMLVVRIPVVVLMSGFFMLGDLLLEGLLSGLLGLMPGRGDNGAFYLELSMPALLLWGLLLFLLKGDLFLDRSLLDWFGFSSLTILS